MALAHLFVLGAWAGLVLAEGVIEILGRDDEGRKTAARLHYWIDVLVEAPLLVGVVVTGALLALRVPVLTPLHWLKMGAGLVAVAANAYCVAVVVRRYHQRDDLEALAKHSARIKIVSPAIGVPFALVAAYIGLAHFAG